MKYFLFCGGGSAGHVIPNLAIMNELKYSHKLAYFGTGGLEKSLVGDTCPFFEADCPKLKRSVCVDNLKIPLHLFKAEKTATDILKREQPDLVFSKGGYASFPLVKAAFRLGIPVYAHESDFTCGLVNKLTAKKCKVLFTSFPETSKLYQNGLYVGSPIRKQVFQGDKFRARRKYGFNEEKPVLLVLGGGSGSVALNEAVHGNLKTLLKTFQILHLCGNHFHPTSAEGYVSRAFENDMGSAYAASDYALSRAGSNAAFELLALKIPTLFVPLEKCSRGDQVQNALYFQKHGWCRVLSESNLHNLTLELKDLTRDNKLKDNLKTCIIENGTPKIVEVLCHGAS